MIIVRDFEQGSPEWLAAKAGLPSSSNFDKLVTPKGKPSEAWENYALDLITQKHMPDDKESVSSFWMDRGVELEPEGRQYYEEEKFIDVEQVGLVYSDKKKLVCASPDGLVAVDGSIEIKCLKGTNHLKVLRSQQMPDKFKPQTQGVMWICECEWIDFVAYHPVFKKFIQRQYRDEQYITLLESSLAIFLERMAEIEKQVIE
jgi:hypothetical protein